MTKVTKKITFTRKERIDLFIQRGYTANTETGEVFNAQGKIYNTRHSTGYIIMVITLRGKSVHLKAHQFIWFLATGEVSNVVDHDNRIKHDNRFVNLNNGTQKDNTENNDAKGCYFSKKLKKWHARITIGDKIKHLGFYDTEEEAHRVFNEAKEFRKNKLPLPKRERKCLGICFHKRTKRWAANFKINGKLMYLGYYDTAEEARAAHLAEKAKHVPIEVPNPERSVAENPQ